MFDSILEEFFLKVKFVFLVDGDVISWMFFVEFCQLSIDGCNGSNVCSVILLVVVYIFFIIDIFFLFGNYLFLYWIKFLYLCMCFGNVLYDNVCQFLLYCYLNVVEGV